MRNVTEMFQFFIENKLISSSQSGFKPSDYCINQLLSSTHGIYSYFDECLEVRSVFVYISKAFYKVWHDDFHKKNVTQENLLLQRKFSILHMFWYFLIHPT